MLRDTEIGSLLIALTSSTMRAMNRPGFDGGSISWRMEPCQTTPAATTVTQALSTRAEGARRPDGLRDHRADRRAQGAVARVARQPRHRRRVAAQLGPPGRDRPRHRAGLTTEERRRIVELERENRELRRANEILKSAAAFFGAELDRRSTEMTRYIDEHARSFGVEPICRTLADRPFLLLRRPQPATIRPRARR